ncbi:MAG: DegT/DnrJ/EryC1/StrS aminotransferase family protein [Chloroflexi bacterium]|nr:DegT/DnrJ/EryC1/StrS aminotransferase family protein [Chloroflexota bacterium]
MEISRKATITDKYLRRVLFYENARTGFRAFLQAAFNGRSGKVLLPAYIGWSPKEGSGVFDPVAELGMDYVFYRMTEGLHIDMEDAAKCFMANDIIVAVVIHYFGYVDPAYGDFVAAAHDAGAVVLEDEAHSMLSDIIGGICGRAGEACIYSLHKLLPMDNGGVLVLNSDGGRLPAEVQSEAQDDGAYWDYDLLAIARRRRENAVVLSQMLQKLAGEVDLLWPVMKDGIVPQTLPVLIRNVSRDRLYKVMNLHGYGIVSLYHTLVEQIKTEEFPASHELSHKIMNLPVHQDVSREELNGLVDCLAAGIANLKS